MRVERAPRVEREGELERESDKGYRDHIYFI